MSTWSEIVLGKGLDVLHGFAFKGEHFREEGELIVLTPGNFFDRGGFKPKSGKEKYYEGPFPPKFLLGAGDVVVAMTEQAVGLLGSSATIPADDVYLHNQRIGLVRITNPEVLDERFVYHLMNTPVVRQQLQATATGTKVRHTAPERIKAVRALVPCVALQQKIASILDTLDELLRNNRRRAKVLEEMARAIYREWFVHLRYPGHEDVPFVDSSFGSVPDGWTSTVVSEVAEAITRGVAPRYADAGEWTVINQKCIRDERLSLDKARRQERAVALVKRVRKGDVLINSTGIGTLGRAAVCLLEHPNLTVDTHVTIARPSDLNANPWFGLNLVGRQAEFEQLAKGSTGQTELSRSDIGALPIVVPPEPLLLAFGDAVWPLMGYSSVLLDRNQSLASLRDLLLPKLVTGKIDVSELDLDALTEGPIG